MEIPTHKYLFRRVDTSLARDSISLHFFNSIRLFGANYVPPTQNTLFNARYSEVLSRVTQPVAHNLILRKVPLTAFKKSTPSKTSAGKSFSRSGSNSIAKIASLIVETPGKVGTILSLANFKSSLVYPGLTTKSTPASMALSN